MLRTSCSVRARPRQIAMSSQTKPFTSEPQITNVAGFHKDQVRVEADDSLGRSYARGGDVSTLVPGRGAARRALRSTVWRSAYWPAGGLPPALESYTLALPHLAACSREDIAAYFENTWALTEALFCALENDSIFYAIPDALRRPLIFYSAHAATVYANKMHLAGLIGAQDLGGGYWARALRSAPRAP